jgi:hypothetical protein
MAFGEGKYDQECQDARIATRAVAALLIVIEGDKGTGFSMQTVDEALLRVVPALLRQVADSIATDLRARGHSG